MLLAVCTAPLRPTAMLRSSGVSCVSGTPMPSKPVAAAVTPEGGGGGFLAPFAAAALALREAWRARGRFGARAFV